MSKQKNSLTLVERAAAAASAHADCKPYDVCHLIIEKPERQQPGQKLLLGGITLLFWGIWSFLWARRWRTRWAGLSVSTRFTNT